MGCSPRQPIGLRGTEERLRSWTYKGVLMLKTLSSLHDYKARRGNVDIQATESANKHRATYRLPPFPVLAYFVFLQTCSLSKGVFSKGVLETLLSFDPHDSDIRDMYKIPLQYGSTIKKRRLSVRGPTTHTIPQPHTRRTAAHPTTAATTMPLATPSALPLLLSSLGASTSFVEHKPVPLSDDAST